MTDNNVSNKRIAKNTLFLSVRMVVVLVLNLITTRIVLQALGVVDYGVYNVVCGFVSMFGFLNTSMSNGIQRFFNYEYGKNGVEGANKVYCTALYIQATLALIMVILVEAFGLWYLHNKMVIPVDRLVAAEWIFQFAIISFVIGIMQAPFSAAITAHERMDFYAVISVLDAFLKLGIAYLIMIVTSDKLIVYGALFACISLINLLLYFVYCKLNFKEVFFKASLHVDLLKRMLGFSGWNLFGSFSSVMKEQGVNLVINFFFGPVVNAARGIANHLNGGIQHFVNNLAVPVRPQVIQSYATGNLNRSINLTFTISKLSCCLLIMMAIPLSLEINYVLRLWLGNNIPQHASSFAVIVFMTSIVSNLNSATSGIVHATGKMRDYQLWGNLIGMSAVPLSFFILKHYSIPEIALISVLVCSCLGHIVCLFVVRKLVGMSLRLYFKEVVLPIVLVLIVSFILSYPIHLIFSNDLLRLLMVSLFSFIIVVLTLYFFALKKSERKLFINLAKSFAIKLHILKS